MERKQVTIEVGTPIAVRGLDEKRRIVLPKEAVAQGGRFIVYVVRLSVEVATKTKKYGILLVPTEG